MIEDKELSDLFRVESEEHISKIEDGLLIIEKQPEDGETLHEIFREAHSLKGAARMLGVLDVETLSHLLEELLRKASKGEISLSSQLIDQIYYTLDEIKKLVEEAITGEKSNVDVIETIEILQGKSPIPAKNKQSKRFPEEKSLSTSEVPKKSEKSDTAPEAVTQETIESEKASTNLTKKPQKPNQDLHDKKNDTMRVDSQKLDHLMVQAGELIVTKLRIGRRLKDIEELYTAFEELQKLNQESRRLIKTGRQSGTQNIALQKYDSLQHTLRDKADAFEKSLDNLQKRILNDSTKLDLISGKLEDGIRNIRMLPLSSIFNLFNRTVRDLSRSSEKDINFVTTGGDITVDKQIIEDLKDPLMHLIRNAIDHGIESPEERMLAGKTDPGQLKLSGIARNNMVSIQVQDNGRGIDIEKVKTKAIEKELFTAEELSEMDDKSIYQIIFMHGFSTRAQVSEISGRGIGMDIVKTFIDQLKGSIEISSHFGIGTTFSLSLPIRFSTTHVLIIEVDKKIYGLPIDYIVLSKVIHLNEIYTLGDMNTVTIEEEPIPVAFLKDLLDIPSQQSDRIDTSLSCITISDGKKKLGLIVDKIVDKQEVIMKPLGGFLKRVRNVAGGTILESGEVCIILNPKDLLQIPKQALRKKPEPETGSRKEYREEKKAKILIAEDSKTIRTQIKRILETENYSVETAVDGREALEKIQMHPYSLLLTDVEMPNLNGFQLTKALRSHSQEDIKEIPIVILTSLGSAENIQAGMEAGANAYLIKSSFKQKELLQTIQRYV
ncbi:MAG: hybrid sensor histidine kinase/response regulator [Spirochaetota bacterium]